MEGAELPDRDGLALRARQLFYLGRSRHCPLCGGSYRAFHKTGVEPRRLDAKCPGCGSLERHRLASLFLSDRSDLLTGAAPRVLHIAPEPALRAKLEGVPGVAYLSADLEPGEAMVQMDISEIQYPAESFDLIYCSHVLEHVPDDRLAMRELHRVLAPHGAAVIAVPITASTTVEDATLDDPEERLRRFGQRDHVRRYGPDVLDRLRDSGFEVRVVDARDLADPTDVIRLGLTIGQPLYVCRKR